MIYNTIAVTVSVIALLITACNNFYIMRRNYSLDKRSEINYVEEKIISFFIQHENNDLFLKSVNYEAQHILFSIEMLLTSKKIREVCDSIYFYDFINLIESCEDIKTKFDLGKFPKLKTSYYKQDLRISMNKC